MSKKNFDFKYCHNFLLRHTSRFFALFLLLVIMLVPAASCSLFNGSDDLDATYEFQFDDQPDDWSALFTNYWEDGDGFELESGYRPLPEPLDTTRHGFYLSGKNLSDDLNMYLKHRIEGLDPGTTYRINLEVSLATDAPSGCLGVGGAPGESVTVHADASPVEPDRRQVNHHLNLADDYEGSGQNWYRATEIGDVANSRECEEELQYELKTITGEPKSATADSNGSLWVLVGTRSGFEATTSLYYTEVNVMLRGD